jgi:hypothetical protein
MYSFVGHVAYINLTQEKRKFENDHPFRYLQIINSEYLINLLVRPRKP